MNKKEDKIDWEKFDRLFTSRCQACHGQDFQLKVEIDTIPLSLPAAQRVACSNCGKAYMIQVSAFLGDEPPVKNPIQTPIRVWTRGEAPAEFRQHQEDEALWVAHVPARMAKDPNFYMPSWLDRLDSVGEPKKVTLPDGSVLYFGNK